MVLLHAESARHFQNQFVRANVQLHFLRKPFISTPRSDTYSISMGEDPTIKVR